MRFFLACSFALFGPAFFAPTSYAYTVESISPQGEAKNVRQVRLVFSDPMISFGDPNVTPGTVVACSSLPKGVEGNGRWLSVKEWVYEFSRELPAGVACDVKLTSGLQDLKKTALSGGGAWRFSTGGPAITSVKPYPGAPLDAEATVLVLLDAVPDPASVLAHAYFTASGIGEKIGVIIGDDATTKAVVKQAYLYGDEKQKIPLLLIAKRRFSAKAKLKLIWDKGIKSKSGIATSVQQQYEFTVREDFSAKFACQRESANAQCSPFSALRIEMTHSIPGELAAQFELHDAAGTVIKPKKTTERDVSWVYFDPPFAPQMDYTVVLPKNLKDVDGRPLANAAKFPLKVKTADYAPLAKFSARFGLIEATPDAALPLAIRKIDPELNTKFAEILRAKGENGKEFLGVEWRSAKSAKVEKPQDVIYWLDRLDAIDREVSLFDEKERIYKEDASAKKWTSSGQNLVFTTPLKMPVPNSNQETQVIGIPLASKGFHLVEIESPVLAKALIGEKASFYVPAGALVTNMAVHFKWGGARSLAWVTTLDEARPVSRALVQLFDCAGRELFSGSTDSDGVVIMDKNLPAREAPRCGLKGNSPYNQGLFVFATKGDDFTFTHTGWQNGIENWRFSVPTSWDLEQDYAAHTIMDRTLLRAGEAVHMKHVFRKKMIEGFARAGKEQLPEQLEISFMDGNTWKFPLHWRSDGTAETTWKIPKEAKLGVYHLRMLSPRERGEHSYGTGSFEVQEFRVPLMKTTLKMPATPPIAVESLDIPIQVQYMAGGAASQLPVKLRGIVGAKNSFNFPAWRDFSFVEKRVKVGISKQESMRDRIEDGDAEFDSAAEPGPGDESVQPIDHDQQTKQRTLNLTLDASGGAVGSFKNLPKAQGYEFSVEAEYRDPNGETQISRQTTTVYPANRLIGFDQTRWVNLKDDLQLKMIVVDSLGKPQSGVAVDVALYTHKINSHRKRIIGGFYSYENYDEIAEAAPEFCHAVSDKNGLVSCKGKTNESGELIAQATVKDAAGHVFHGYSSFWVRGGDDWWFSQEAGDRIDLIPERKEYNPGDIAVFQVRSPFRTATALVTTEREGVMDHFVTTVSGKDATIGVPIKGNYGPNVYVSALLVRGRVAEAKSTALLDLGKPAFKMGLSGIKVGWDAHRLEVSVTPDRQVYKIREKVRVKIKVQPDGRGEAFKGGTILVAAVDEGLLQLMPNKSWDLLAPMMGDRQHAVRTSTGQLQVIGKRHFGLKAIAAGGGGGAGGSRKLFDTLLLWQDQIVMDESGRATVEIPLNDSLTSFRIVAIAMSGEGLFGTGETSIRTSQDILVFSGLPPFVREGDKFSGAVTLRNTSESKFDVNVAARVEGRSVKGQVQMPELPLRSLHLDPGQSTDVRFEVVVPNDVSELQWVIETKTDKDKLLDRMEAKQQVKPVLPVRVLQTTLQRAAPQISLEVERPKNAVPNRGGFRVELSSSLVPQLSTSQSYMIDYPYSCLEQQISKAVSLNDQARWTTVVEGLGAYLDHDGLAKFFPDERWGYDVLTSYVLSVAARNHFDIPAVIKSRMTSGLVAWLSGRVSHQDAFVRPDRPIRQIAALLALSLAANDTFKAKMVEDYVEIQPQLWPTTALITWYELLLREPGIAKRNDFLKVAETQIKTRLHTEGNLMAFAKDDDTNPYWLMTSSTDALARLIGILSDMEDPLISSNFREDVPRMVQGLFMKQSLGHWSLTTENAWAAVGLRAFGNKFEKEQVAGATVMSLNGEEKKWSWPGDHKTAQHLQQPMEQLANPASFDFAMHAAKGTLQIRHTGNGSPWALVSSRFAIPVTKAVKNGMSLERKITAVEQKIKGTWSKGDIVRVDLAMSSSAAQVWVVLNDPIPAGATIVGGVGNKSSLVTTEAKTTDLIPTFQERSFEGMRAYYAYVPDRSWTYSYSFRLNQDGVFLLPASRIEAMYAPAMYAEVPAETWTIE